MTCEDCEKEKMKLKELELKTVLGVDVEKFKENIRNYIDNYTYQKEIEFFDKVDKKLEELKNAT